MKHLRDYNEGKIEDDCTLMDYVDNCFIEFKDNNNYFAKEVYKGTRKGLIDYMIVIRPPIINFYNGLVEERISELDKVMEFYLEIENCIDKIRLKYPNMTYILKKSEPPYSRTNTHNDDNIILYF
jgi:hypothetical protein